MMKCGFPGPKSLNHRLKYGMTLGLFGLVTFCTQQARAVPEVACCNPSTGGCTNVQGVCPACTYPDVCEVVPCSEETSICKIGKVCTPVNNTCILGTCGTFVKSVCQISGVCTDVEDSCWTGSCGISPYTFCHFESTGLCTKVSLTCQSECAGPCPIYVNTDATGADDGSSWDDAYTKLQDALDAAVADDHIWVAKGTYYPDEGASVTAGDRDATFDVGGGNGPKLYGGFVGTELSLGARSWKCYDGTTYDGACPCVSGEVCLPNNETILSGDLAGDDTGTCTLDTDCDTANYSCSGSGYCECTTSADCGPEGTCTSGLCTCFGSDCASGGVCTTGVCNCSENADCRFNYCLDGSCLIGLNSFHVVSCHHSAGGTPRLDGFIIEGGMADGNGPLAPSDPALDNQGAAIQIRAGTKYCQDSTNGWASPLVECPATACSGGDTCEFFPCFAGGMDVSNCMIRRNFASDHGAVNDHFANSTFDNCYFHHNRAIKGGALLVDNGSPSITDCMFEDNQAGEIPQTGVQGGALWLQGRDGTSTCPSDPAPTITNSTFVGNIADGNRPAGGAIWSIDTAPAISGCTFDSNKITGNSVGFYDSGGGAIWIENLPSNPTATITSSHFVDNVLDTLQGGAASGGAIGQFDGPGALIIDNTSFVRNNGQVNGGALAVWLDTKMTCTNCLFFENMVDYGRGFGSGVFIQEPEVGGLTVTVDLINCTFVGNRNLILSGDDSLIMVFDRPGNSAVSIKNCILWGNYPDSEIDDTLASYSCIEGWTSGGNDNTGDDPKFISVETGEWSGVAAYDSGTGTTTFTKSTASWDANEFVDLVLQPDTLEPDYAIIAANTATTITARGEFDSCSSSCSSFEIVDIYLDDTGNPGSNSPCIDAGDDDALPADTNDCDGDSDTTEDIPCDLDGNTRVVDKETSTNDVDMGCYEVQ